MKFLRRIFILLSLVMRILRRLLFPFSMIYGSVIFVRNKLYDWNILPSYLLPQKSICIGNLSAGGTGKTPMTLYLANYLSPKLETAILSRGYGRKTKGFILANEHSSAQEIGDEPRMYAEKFANTLHIAVCENRKEGIDQLLKRFPSNRLFILDDAMQHRRVKAGFTILLSNYHSPYWSDCLLPVGNLRETHAGASRADCLVITKCPEDLSAETKKQLAKRSSFPKDKVFFSTIGYSELLPVFSSVGNIQHVLLVTGIANPVPLVKHLKKSYQVTHINFGDHHNFTTKEIQEIHQKFDTFASDNKIIVTTEKDLMRLKQFSTAWGLNRYPWYVQPIQMEIQNENEFEKLIDQYVDAL
jgi:tetraacyldisaccharide 4'-kinase